jgi:hypothetical protein
MEQVQLDENKTAEEEERPWRPLQQVAGIGTPHGFIELFGIVCDKPPSDEESSISMHSIQIRLGNSRVKIRAPGQVRHPRITPLMS